ncbi:type II secretion system protein GspG [Candidatus Berkelbacteria bacterium]|nr:type II secretion system protein GspG [Candidatus Berkelbacteria bacterium]
MDLDFGPTEAPSQPPKNPPPAAEGSMKPSGSQIAFTPSGGPVGSPPPATPTGSPPPAAPPAPKKAPRPIFLLIGVLIILAGLGYLAYSLLAGRSSSSGVATTPTPATPSTLDTGASSTATVTPLTPTSGTGTTPTTGTGVTSTTGTTTTGGAGTVSETMQTRDAFRKKDLATIQTYLESYLTDQGSYPVAAKTTRLNDSTATVVTALVPKYTAALPKDPKDPEYFYGYKSVDGKTYLLSARLEDTTDPEGKTEGTVFLYTVAK